MKGGRSVLFLMVLFVATRFRNSIFRTDFNPLQIRIDVLSVWSRRSFAVPPKRFGLVVEGLCRPKDGSKAKYGKCGEDSYTIAPGEERTVLAVADGVGGWGDHGGDSSQVSNGFMRALKRYHQEEREDGEWEGLPGLIKRSFRHLISTGKMKMGTTTICAAAINHDDGSLEVSNIGDSQLVVVRRDGRVVLEVEAGVWAFNSPNQVGFGLYGEPQGDIDEMNIERSLKLETGDVIVIGTDGLFDNVFVEDIAKVVVDSLVKGEEDRSGWIVKRLVREAYEKGLDDDYLSPFAREAIEARKAPPHYRGGKPDDISVIVAEVI